VNQIRRDDHKVTGMKVKQFVIDKEPGISLGDIVNLIVIMGMVFRHPIITGTNCAVAVNSIDYFI
jgi:hypothetical protein